MQATEKQIDYLLSLWNRINDKDAQFLSQTDIPLSQRQRRGGLTKAKASVIIDELLAELEEKDN
ncbi:hypothetical protein [Corynebacterium ulcerans]|uniref:hypothetical protein n=1 Tax=Corynebacterium ulcerans TaxID=65058 RepID=UPI0018D9A4BA|nr:hypothetical protein [Corynebacterium ulcerans]MBH5296177.1 hypothetical protein [Corynebacterium ulcerans]